MKWHVVKTLILLEILVSTTSYSQGVKLVANNIPVNQVLIELRKEYDIQLSFNDQMLSEYTVSANRSFSSVEETLDYIVKGIPISYQKLGNVYVFKFEANLDPPKDYLVLGKIVDKTNGEGLPFAQVSINEDGLITDFNGNFSYTSNTDSIFQLQVSYLGYYYIDTIVPHGDKQQIELTPSLIGLKEVIVKHKAIDYTTHLGVNPGETKVNHKIATFLPGYGDNSVFNLLRLQPGILAAGEHSSDLIIWGCHQGQSKVLFDGFTIYGLKNYNDNISAVNPLITKDIKILKGGYSANYGERVGGIVDITGLSGNMRKTSATVSINNMTLSGKISKPLGKSTLLAAFRQTYYDLYSPEDITKRNINEDITEINPDYTFQDFNVKLSGEIGRNDNYYISTYSSSDEFNVNAEHEQTVQLPRLNTTRIYDVSIINTESNKQYGGAAFYGKHWDNGHSTGVTLNYTYLNTTRFDNRSSVNRSNNNVRLRKDEEVQNSIVEQGVNFKHAVSVKDEHMIELGGGYIDNSISLQFDSLGVITGKIDKNASRINFYINEKIRLNQFISLNPGIRVDYPLEINKTYWQPRISMNVQLAKSYELKFATGVYNQFVVQSSEVDDYGNLRYLWTLSDAEYIPVLSSIHYVFGNYYQKNNWLFSMESFYKSTDGLTNVKSWSNFRKRNIRLGVSRTYGVDFYLKKEYKGSSTWISYTLSKTEEKFNDVNGYKVALHDQRHEIKMAGLLNLSPFYISANYVYGSGFPDPATVNKALNELTYSTPYSRLDASFVYRFHIKLVRIEGGISVLNLLNKENIKYESFYRIPAYLNSTVAFKPEAMPFTPTLFLIITY